MNENLTSKTTYTKVYLLKQITTYFVLIMAFSIILINFEAVRRVGISILASAGFLTVVAGLAAQKTLSSLFLGLQLAFTQPIKIGDAIFIEKEFGTIEEITLTYVVVKLWDLRRLIVPPSYFLKKPFQNWTRNSQDLLGSAMLYIDYAIPIDLLRGEFNNIIKSSKLWDGKVGLMHITDFKKNTLEIRFLVSAKNVDDLWNLRAEVRERILFYLQNNFQDYFPTFRVKKQK